MRFVVSIALFLPLFCGLAAKASAEEFLAPNQAFRIAAKTDADGRVLLRFDITPGHYMYREAFRVVDEAGRSLSLDGLPAAERKYDPAFEREMQIYRGQLSLHLVLHAATSHLLVSGQGCADKGLCYAPMTSTMVSDPSGRWELQAGDDPEGEFGVAPNVASLSRAPHLPTGRPKYSALLMLFTALAGLLLMSRRA